MPSLETTSRIVNIIIFIVSVVLTGLSASNLRIISTRHLPIPTITQILALALPLVQLIGTLLLACGFRTSHLIKRPSASSPGNSRPRQSQLLTLTNLILWVLSILDTVLLSTSAFALDPGYLDCTLEQSWKQWFMHKNADPVRSIQDRYNCCGLRSNVDRAWPFPDARHNARSCIETHDRTASCLGAWEGNARSVLATFTAVGAVSLALKLVVALVYSGMQVDDFSFGIRRNARRDDPARRRLLEDQDRERLPVNGNGIESSIVREED